MRALILTCLLLAAAPAIVAGEVVVLDETTAEAMANALRERATLMARLELAEAKLAAADERNALLVELLAAKQALIDSLSQRTAELQGAVERSAEDRTVMLATLEQNARALDRAQRALEAVGKRPWWEKTLDWMSRLLPIALFLAL